MASATAATVLFYVGTAASLIGGGVSAFSSYRTGKINEAIASFNAKNQEKNARMELMAMQTQANLAKTQAEQEFQLRQQEAQARANNATSIENQALSQDAVNRANLRKRREEQDRAIASQRAAIAASGAVESTGTPLDVLAETAGIIQQDQNEQQYANELDRSTLFREADMERLGGRLALAGATLGRDSSLAAAALSGNAARSQYIGNLRSAQITRAEGRAASKAGLYQAGATLLSSKADAAYKASNYYSLS